MYTATIKTKEEIPTGVRVTVTFTNGTNTFDEVIEPDTKSQFHSWVAGILFTLNQKEEMKTDLSVDRPVETPTQAELDKREWFRQYNLLGQLEILEAKGFLTGAKLTELTTKLAEVKTFLDANIKTEYLNDL